MNSVCVNNEDYTLGQKAGQFYLILTESWPIVSTDSVGYKIYLTLVYYLE